jgi:hypothetical protein
MFTPLVRIESYKGYLTSINVGACGDYCSEDWGQMAKRSFGSIFAAAVGYLAFAAYRGYKEKKQAAEGDYRTAFRSAQREHAGAQAAYEGYVASLPKALGDGTFGLVADTTTGDRFALEAFTQYLDLMHEKEQVLTAVLIAETGIESPFVTVELSQAHVGIVSPKDSEPLLAAMANTKGKVTCSAKLRRLNYGDTYQLLLDVKLPIEIEGD